MSLQTTQCSLCNSVQPCYHVCCMVIFLCRDCLLDSDALSANNQCPQCYRQLQAVYRSLVNKARFGDGANRMSQKSFTNNNLRSSQVHQKNNLMRNQISFQSTRHQEEQEFQFAQTLHQKQSQVKKIRNDFSSLIKNNTNQYQDIHHQRIKNNSYVQSKPFLQQMNRETTSFSPRHNFKCNQFNGHHNNFFDPQSCSYQNPYISNLGYQHQNEIQMNNNNFYQHPNNGHKPGFGKGGFTQKIRQSRPLNQNNTLHNNIYPNNFIQNNQYQHIDQSNFGQNYKGGNQFSIYNQQQRANNIHQNNINPSFTQGQNQLNFKHQNSHHNSNSFQFQDNSFQNFSSHQRATKSVGKVHQLKRFNLNSKNGKSSSFKVDNQGNNSGSEKQHSPSFGGEFHNDPSLSRAIVQHGNCMQGGNDKMELEQNIFGKSVNRTKSHDSLMTLGNHNEQLHNECEI